MVLEWNKRRVPSHYHLRRGSTKERIVKSWSVVLRRKSGDGIGMWRGDG